MGKTDYGKGDANRTTNFDEYRRNYNEIFGEKPIKVWKPDPEDDPRNKVATKIGNNDDDTRTTELPQSES